MSLQSLLEKDFTDIINEHITRLDIQSVPVRMNMAVDVGTSKTRALPFAFSKESNSINAKQIIKIPNKFAKLNASDLRDVMNLEFEEANLMNMMCITLENTTNGACPLYKKPVTVSKGLLSDKLLKNSGFSVSNTMKVLQEEEFIINTYSIIVASIYANVVYFLEQGEVEKARDSLNVELNLAYMLPDEEKLDEMTAKLYKALQGTVEFSIPTMNELKGRFTIRNNAPHQWLDLYGEAESVIYYFLTKHPEERYRKAFANHGVSVIDVGEGSVDIVFFKEKELMDRASDTNREVNGLTLINRTLKNVRNKATKEGKFFRPAVESIKAVLESDSADLILETPSGEIDIADCLTDAKKEIAAEIANIFKNTFEQNTVLGLDRLFLIILAGRTMTDSEKSPSLGIYIAERLAEQLMIPKDICKLTHPDSNLIGSALKLFIKMKKFSQGTAR